MPAPRAFLAAAALVVAGAACAAPSADLGAWTAATRELRAAVAREFETLAGDAVAPLEATSLAADDVRRLLEKQSSTAATHAGAWLALEEHCARLDPLAQALAYDPRGALPAAESWRRMVLDLERLGVAVVAERDATARALARERDAARALERADPATVAVCESLARHHQAGAARLRAAAAAAEARLREGDAGREQRRAALALLVERAEDELRMTAAGAGRTGPGALEHLADDRAALAEVVSALEDSARRRDAALARIERSARLLDLAAHAAREWALAQREAAQALTTGGRPEFRRLRASSAAAASL